jgi:hypothetical protein
MQVGRTAKVVAFLCVGVAASLPVMAKEAVALDQGRIHHYYNEGDFDHVVAVIDSFTNSHKIYSHDDSIFIAKHLSVVYAANPATREKGKGYMYRLLDLMPSAKIVDMFVSDEIDRIFEKVREEYGVRDEMMSKQKPETKSSLKPVYWIAGGVAFAAISGTVIYYMNSDPPKDKVYGLPPK